MKFSESWLRTFINPKLTANQLSYALTMAGLEIESLSRVMPEISKIVVGQIIEISKNTSSKKLNVCQVDIGRRTPLHIVCSASNVRQGIKIPVAFVDAELPIMKENGKSLINRIESQGMLCSKNDLKLSEDHVRVLILPEDLQIGQDISNALNLNDMIFEIKLTPNRADCLSVFGIAREIAAITGSPLTPIDIYPVQVELDDILPVKITAPDLCGRFSGRVIRDVNVHVKTPNWMIQRLEQSGQRSVSTLIDISNYVMLELGQPSHLSDLDKISGGIYIRWGNDNESLKLLNGDTIELDNKVGVVADMSKIGSLAGIIGGHSTAVTLDTKNIYIESAFWCPSSIQGRARKYGLSTEAAHRFERGVDYAATVKSIERITKLILDICGGRAGPVDDHIINLPKRLPVEVRISKVNRIICASLNTRDVERIFNRLDMSFKKKGDVFSVTPPSYRFDIEIEEDLIEEIARIHGFEKIPERLPKSINKIHVSKETQRSIHDVRHMLAARDYIETINFSFVSSECEHDFSEKNKPIHLLNPISKQFSVMRSTLFGGLISVLLYNLKRQVYRIRIFEIGSIFISDPSVRDTELTVKGYAQPKRVCVLAYGPAFDLQWGISRRNIDFFDVKGDLEALLFPSNAHFVKASHPALHPGRSAKIKIDGQEAISGWIGELHPKLMQKYELPYPPILFEIDADALIFRMIPRISNVSKFPLVQRDISIIVNESIEVQSLLNDMKRALIEGDRRFIKSIILFDQFSSKKSTSKQRTLDSLSAEEKSLTFRVTLQDLECTLRDEIVNQLIQTIISRITNKYGARLRRP